MEKVLLLGVLLLQALMVGAAGWVWWKGRSSLTPAVTPGLEELRHEARSLERFIEAKVDLLLAQILAQRPPAFDLKELGALLDSKCAPAPAGEEPKFRSEVPEASKLELELLHFESLPQIPHREEDDPQGAGARLANALSSGTFRADVWTEMNGPFEAACSRLLVYLSGLGVAEPEIEPFPPIENGASNHWLFLAVAHRDPQAKTPRLLLPRNFSLYDPLQHDHLFKLLGAPTGSGEPFIRELREYAVLEPVGALEGFISKELVVHRGIVVV